jgi:hypothetical protein
MPSDVPVTQITGLSPDLLEKLRQQNLTTAEELTARAGTADAIRELASALDVQPNVVEDIVARAKDALDAAPSRGEGHVDEQAAPGGRQYTPTGSYVIDHGVCAACGRGIQSVRDVAGECLEPGCSNQICEICWNSKGVQHCSDHAEGAPEA